MDRACSTNEMERNAYRILVGKIILKLMWLRMRTSGGLL
jgi:hypothetical protein